ncbi:hypothetical protein ACHAW6_007663 [Cyclotella cf. meneghiniana]
MLCPYVFGNAPIVNNTIASPPKTKPCFGASRASKMVYTEEGNIQLQHALNLTLPSLHPSIERTLRSIESSFREISHSVTLVGYAAAAFFIMAGVARLMEARKNGRFLPPPPPPPPPPCFHREPDKSVDEKNRTL